MTTAREIMSRGAECVRTDETAADAARKMKSLGVGALPICGKDERLKGVVTDRDIVVKVIAESREAGGFPAGDLNQIEAVTIGADDPVDEVLATMTQHKVKRLPVIDGDRLIGIISLADLARALPQTHLGELVESLSID